MKVKKFFFLFLFLLHQLVFAGSLEQEPILPFQFAIEPNQKTIQAFKGDGIQHVMYELIVSNLSQDAIRIRAVNVVGKECKNSKKRPCCFSKPTKKTSCLNRSCEVVYKKKFGEEEVPLLFSLLNDFSNRLVPTDPVVPPNESAILYLFLNFPSLDEVPDLLENSLDLEINGQPETVQNILSDPILVDKSSPIIIHPPLKGKNWYGGAAPSNLNYHRRTVVAINGNLLLPERFAVDFVQYGPGGIFAGSPFDNQSYYCYGQKVFAVADGTVIRVMDGIPDNTPGSFPPIIDPEAIGGNYVLMRIDPSHYAFYAHLIPGSIEVRKGDKVKAGQLLGLLGNSGNSNFPHLHFQMTTKPRPLGRSPLPYPLNAQGIPWIFNHFIKENYLPVGQNPIDPTFPLFVVPLGQTKVRRQIVMDKNLVNFSRG